MQGLRPGPNAPNDLDETSEGLGIADAKTIARRDALKVLAGATGLLVGHAVLPRTWDAPLLIVSRLPAHATTSDCIDPGATTGNTLSNGLTAVREEDGRVVLRWRTWGISSPMVVYRKETSAGASDAGTKLGRVDAQVSSFVDYTARTDLAYFYWLDGKDNICVEHTKLEAAP